MPAAGHIARQTEIRDFKETFACSAERTAANEETVSRSAVLQKVSRPEHVVLQKDSCSEGAVLQKDSWPKTASAQVRICILDSGCDQTDISGWNYTDQNDDLSDHAGHGTKICTILKECAPDAELIMLKCFASDTESEVSEESMIQAVLDAAEIYHADVISMSWTSVKESEALHEAIQKAYDSGCILVASAGNLSFQTPLGSRVYPAAWEEVIGVGGAELDGNGEPVSSLWYLQSDAVFVCTDGEYEGEHGSSFAAPRVAAFIARYLIENPEAREEQVREYLKAQTLDLGTEGYDTVFGWGYLETR